MSGNGNPKDFVGASKAPTSTISRRVLHELGLAMLEGECKYWRHNYRAAHVRAMIYLDAMDRHVSAWIEGQEIDPASGVSHLIKAMACLMIVRDAQLYGSLIDDRPPAQSDPNWLDELNAKALSLVKVHEHITRGAYLQANRGEWLAMSEALSKGPIPALSLADTGAIMDQARAHVVSCDPAKCGHGSPCEGVRCYVDRQTIKLREG